MRLKSLLFLLFVGKVSAVDLGGVADYNVTTTGSAIVVTDFSGRADSLSMSQPSAGNIAFAAAGRTFSVNGGAPMSGGSGVLLLSGVTSITVSTGAGSDVVDVGAFTGLLPALLINGGTGDDTVNFNGDITFASDADLNVDLQNDAPQPGADTIHVNFGANLITSGVGSITVRVAKGAAFAAGSSLVTGQGDLSVEVLGTTTVSPSGITLSGTALTSAGGNIVVTGKGGNGGERGIDYDYTATSITTTGNGTITIVGTSVYSDGIYMENAPHVIQTENGDLSVTGTTQSAEASAEGVSFYSGTDNEMTVRSTGSGNVTLVGSTGGGPMDLLVSGVAVSAGAGGDVSLLSDRLSIYGGATVSTAGTVRIKSLTPGRPINIGTDVADALGVTDFELNNISAGTVQIGDSSSGAITVTAEINPSAYKTLHLQKGVTFSETGGFVSELASRGVIEKILVNGPVSIHPSATLTVSATGGFVPGGTDSFTILDNVSADSTTGSFAGLAEGASIDVGGVSLRATYGGGTGNELVLVGQDLNGNSVGSFTTEYSSGTYVPLTTNSFTATGRGVYFRLNYAPATGTNLTVVNNAGLAFINGTFSNLAQWQPVDLTFEGQTYRFIANYFGGTGNDLVLVWADTRAAGWGSNSNGQLGNNSTTASQNPVSVNTSGVLVGKGIIAVSAGNNHSVALCTDGTVVAWGLNDAGQLGNNSTVNSLVPVAVNMAGVLSGRTVIAVAAGYQHTLVLCSDGRVFGWGSGGLGQLGTSPAANSLVPVAVNTSGMLSGKTVIAIAAGFWHNVALCSDGTVVSWGYNGTGQLGNNSTTSSNTPVAVNTAGVLSGRTVIAVDAGWSHSMALCSDGSVVTWGDGQKGQLGNNTLVASSVPVLVNTAGVLSGKTVTAIAAGNDHCVVLCSDGTLASWGDAATGQLGNGGTTMSQVPVAVTRSGVLSGKTVTAVSAGFSKSLALCSDGTLAKWGDFNSSPVAVSTSSLASGARFVAGISDSTAIHSLGIVALPLPPLPVTVFAATAVTASSATLNGTVNPEGAAATAFFQYSTSSDFSFGVTTIAGQSVGSGTSAVSVSQSVSGLLAHTTYYFRTGRTNSAGTKRSAILPFTTGNTNPVAGTGTGPVGTGETTLVTLPFTTPDADGDTVTVSGTPTVSVNAPFTLGDVEGNQIEVTTSADAAGSGTIYFTVSDGFGGTASGSVAVTVADNGAPVVTAPANVRLEATGPGGRHVTFVGGSAVDAVDGPLSVTYVPASGMEFPIGRTLVTASAEDEADNVGTATFTVTITPGTHDTTPPVLKLASPTGSSVTGRFTLSGTVRDNYGLDYLRVTLNGQPLTLDTPLESPLSSAFPRNADNPWSATGVMPENGHNFIEVEAVDLKGLRTRVTKSFTYWNQRAALAGIYPALVIPEATPGVATSGLVNVTVLNTGAFSGKVTINGAEIPVMGVLRNDGAALFRGVSAMTTNLPLTTVERTLVKLGASPTVRTLTRQHGTLSLEVTEDSGLSGVLTDGVGPEPTAVASFKGKKAPYSKTNRVPVTLLNLPAAAPIRGYYTVVLSPESEDTDDDGEDGAPLPLPAPSTPQGDGYAALTLGNTGSTVVVGHLADGTAWSAGGYLRSDGTIAVFSPLYGRKGGLAGEVKLDVEEPDSDLSGEGFLWIRPVQPAALQYVSGWPQGTYLDVIGTKFAGGPGSLNWGQGPSRPSGNAVLVFEDGLLSDTVTCRVNVSPATGAVSKVPEANPDYTLSVNRDSGVITGKFKHTDGTMVDYRGIVLQKGGNRFGLGHFLSNGDGGQGGWFILEPLLPE